MKNQFLLCALSAFVGAAVALALQPAPQMTGSALAQVQIRPTVPRTGVTPPATVPGTGAMPALPHTDEIDRQRLQELTPEERVNVLVYQGVNRGVVNINTRSVRVDSFFFLEVPSEGAGSGSVIDHQGHILTNYHVIEGAREIQVTLYDGSTYDAKPVGADPNNDLAVIKIDAPAELLHPVPYGDSNTLLVGQKVYAIGNPFGLERTLSTGIVSSLNRSMRSRNGRTIKSIIQLDADINPGNSGGPLLDSRGRMIGMTTAIASNTGQSAGVGFAIPVSTIARIVPQLIENGRVIRADIGIGKVLQTEEGLLIASVIEGGAADRAGLQGFRIIREQRRQGPYLYERTRVDRSAADLIIAIDGKRVRTVDELLTVVESYQPGTRVNVTVIRGGKEVTVPVTLDESR